MDVAALAVSLISLQAGNTQQQIGNAVLKSNLDAQRNDVLTVLGDSSSPSLANVGPGVGGSLNVSA